MIPIPDKPAPEREQRGPSEKAKRFVKPVARPEWLDDGLDNAMQTFTLARKHLLPDTIKGWMLHTACMRVLRSVHGSDLDSALAVRETAMDSVEFEQSLESQEPTR